MKIKVRDYSFKRDASHSTSTGFIAQKLNEIYPQAVSRNGDNGTGELASGTVPWSVDYGKLTPLIIKGVQDIVNITGIFKENLIKWIASAENGIQDIVTRAIHTQLLCVGQYCVNEEQFGNIINNTNAGSAQSTSTTGGNSSSTGTSTSTWVDTNNGTSTTSTSTGRIIENTGGTSTNTDTSFSDTGSTVTCGEGQILNTTTNTCE
jgi:hypothetical protein